MDPVEELVHDRRDRGEDLSSGGGGAHLSSERTESAAAFNAILQRG